MLRSRFGRIGEPLRGNAMICFSGTGPILRRRASPLTIAEDAHVIDSSSLTIEGVVGEIIGRLKIEGLPEALRLDS